MDAQIIFGEKTSNFSPFFRLSIAFWIKVVSGIPNHLDVVGVMSTMESYDKEGWIVLLFNWQGSRIIKFEVQDYQEPGKRFVKDMDTSITLDEWIHYTIVYKLVDPTDPGRQFDVYKNGQSHNSGSAGSQAETFTQNSVDTLAIGRQYIADNFPPYFNGMLDEVVILPGTLDATKVGQLFQQS